MDAEAMYPTSKLPDGWSTFSNDDSAYYYYDTPDSQTVLFKCRYCGGIFYELRKDVPADYEAKPTCPQPSCLILAKLTGQAWPWAIRGVWRPAVE